MQFMPPGFAVGWDVLAFVPEKLLGRMFGAALDFERGAAPTAISTTDIMRALGKNAAAVAAGGVTAAGIRGGAAVLGLLACDAVTLQLSDDASFAKRLRKAIARLRDGQATDADEATIAALAAAVSEERIAPAAGPSGRVASVAEVGMDGPAFYYTANVVPSGSSAAEAVPVAVRCGAPTVLAAATRMREPAA